MNATGFDDLESDLDFGAAQTARPMAEIAQPQFVTAKRAPTEYSQPCSKCGGSGVYRGPSSYGRDCFACKGAGHITFKSSPEARAKAAQQRAERAARAAQAKIDEFAAQYPAEHAWMVAKAPSFDFASSMLQALQKWGTLTAGQLAAVTRMVAREAQYQVEKAQRAQALAEQAARPVEALHALHGVMQKHAKFYAGELTLSRRNADQLVWIKHANAEKVIGKIDGGVLTLWNRPGVDSKAVRAMLDEFEGAPLQTAMKYGKLSGVCCSCGRELTDDASIAAGIGPICAKKFN